MVRLEKLCLLPRTLPDLIIETVIECMYQGTDCVLCIAKWELMKRPRLGSEDTWIIPER